MKSSNMRCTNFERMVDPDSYFYPSKPTESPERFGDNVKTFKPKILVNDFAGSHMSRNAMI